MSRWLHGVVFLIWGSVLWVVAPYPTYQYALFGVTVLLLVVRKTPQRSFLPFVEALGFWAIGAYRSERLSLDVAAIYLLAVLSPFVVNRKKNQREQSVLDGAQSERLLATLGHEIRTPLTVMQTTQTLLMEQSAGELNKKQMGFVESLYINTQRLITFSEQLLSWIKLEKDWQVDLSQPIDLRHITRQVLTTLGPQLEIRKQEVSLQFPGLLAQPKGDEGWIHQVLVNLVHNASKHTKEGGIIIISVTQDDHQVVVNVTDNGQGISLAGREALFQEFFQEHTGTNQDGFGLGLAIVRNVIAKHHGKVYISSSPNQGTMVSFSLPLEGA